jgi:hypothetical protein
VGMKSYPHTSFGFTSRDRTADRCSMKYRSSWNSRAESSMTLPSRMSAIVVKSALNGPKL